MSTPLESCCASAFLARISGRGNTAPPTLEMKAEEAETLSLPSLAEIRCVPDLAAAEIESEQAHRYLIEVPGMLSSRK
jgi:hypothetical protein